MSVMSIEMVGGASQSVEPITLKWGRFVALDAAEVASGKRARTLRTSALLDETEEDREFWRKMYKASRDA